MNLLRLDSKNISMSFSLQKKGEKIILSNFQATALVGTLQVPHVGTKVCGASARSGSGKSSLLPLPLAESLPSKLREEFSWVYVQWPLFIIQPHYHESQQKPSLNRLTQKAASTAIWSGMGLAEFGGKELICGRVSFVLSAATLSKCLCIQRAAPWCANSLQQISMECCS